MRPPISKIIRAKWTEAVEYLLCKHEALSSKSSPTKKKKKEAGEKYLKIPFE
jgi:hypothetical protein